MALVVVGTERDLLLLLRADDVQVGADVALLLLENVLLTQAAHIVLEADVCLHDRELDALGLFDGLLVFDTDTVHLASDGHELQHDVAIALVLHEPDYLLVRARHTRMVGLGVVRSVELMKVALHGFVHFEAADLVDEAVRISVHQLRGLTHSALHVLIVEAVYEGLGKIQDTEPYVYRLPDGNLRTTKLNCYQVLPEDGCAVEVVLGYEGLGPIAPLPLAHQLDIHPLALVLHGLAVHRVVEQLEEEFLEVILRILPLLAVQVNVRLQPWLLIEAQRSVGLRQAQAVLQGLLESAIVDDIALLAVQSREQLSLFFSRWRHVLWAEGEVLMSVVEVLGVFEDYIKNVALVVIVWHFPEGLLAVLVPAKTAIGQRLSHGPPVEVIYIEVQQVLRLLLWVIELAHIAIVDLGIAVRALTHTTSDASLHQQEHVYLHEQLKFDRRELEHCMSS